MKFWRSLMFGLVATAAFAPSASAGLVSYYGGFDVTTPSGSGLPSQFTGSFAFDFDDSVVTGAAFEWFNVSLTSLTATQIGSTTFTAANTGAFVAFSNGIFDSIAIGAGPGYNGVLPGTDDFAVIYYGPNLNGAVYQFTMLTRVGSPSTYFGIPPQSGTLLAVATPEPSALALAGMGGLVGAGWAWRRRSRKAA